MNMYTHARRDSVIWTPDEVPYLNNIIVYDTLESPGDISPSSYAATDANMSEKNQQQQQHYQTDNMLPQGSMLRVVVLGAAGTGKTSIITRLSYGHTPSDMADPSIRRFQHNIRLNSQTYTIDAIEVSLEETTHERSLAHMVRRSDAAVIVYDATCPRTFRTACELRDRVHDAVATSQEARFYGLALVGNKTDLKPGRRAVSRREGEAAAAATEWPRAMARAGGSEGARVLPLACAFAQVSALSGEGVSKLFFDLSRTILELRRAQQDDEQRRLDEEWTAREERGKRMAQSSREALVPGERTGGKKKNLWKRISSSLTWRHATKG